jgi:hypothetical protein
MDGTSMKLLNSPVERLITACIRQDEPATGTAGKPATGLAAFGGARGDQGRQAGSPQ